MNYLLEFAYVANFSKSIDELAQLAQKENWNYRNSSSEYSNPVLCNYIDRTFKRLRDEGKVSETLDKACFNTGLVTENQEEIFALFDQSPSTPQKWRMKKFVPESHRELLSFNPLPEIAHYFDDPGELLYDTRRVLRINYDHIIEDNKVRFPEPFCSQNNYQLTIGLRGACDMAIKRVKRNYKTAIPQFYSSSRVPDGSIQLLLPLCLSNPSHVDLALVVERIDDVYRAATCLTLDMAYSNARILAQPDMGWLQP